MCFLALLAGCGYHWQAPSLEGKPTLSIPLITGDEEGCLTAELIRAFHRSGLVAVCREGGDYRLHVSLLKQDVTTIGFRRDIERISGKPKKYLIASEARKSLTLEVFFYEGTTDRIAFGPYLITSDADFDYIMGDSLEDLVFSTPSDPLVVVLPFSLGQLEPMESAQEAANKPLYTHLSQKIVDAFFADCYDNTKYNK